MRPPVKQMSRACIHFKHTVKLWGTFQKELRLNTTYGSYYSIYSSNSKVFQFIKSLLKMISIAIGRNTLGDMEIWGRIMKKKKILCK